MELDICVSICVWLWVGDAARTRTEIGVGVGCGWLLVLLWERSQGSDELRKEDNNLIGSRMSLVHRTPTIPLYLILDCKGRGCLTGLYTSGQRIEVSDLSGIFHVSLGV